MIFLIIVCLASAYLVYYTLSRAAVLRRVLGGDPEKSGVTW